MEFFDGDTEEHHQIGNRFCGRNHPQPVESTGQKLLVVFNSDKSENYRGFRALWKTKKISKIKHNVNKCYYNVQRCLIKVDFLESNFAQQDLTCVNVF